MTTLKFADTHNLVVFLSKPTKSEGFKQIVDFLNANPIRYALTINPTIYTSCIEQFWATVKVKTVNGEVQLQALVDGKKIIVTEASVRRDLQLNDEEGTDCLPNATIFEELTRMGYEKLSQKLTFYKAFFSPQWKFLIHTILQCLSAKTTAWNEFSSTMASAIICLATNQKFNFSKYIFESMVKNLENVSGKFLMYPRFVQVFLEKQLEGMSNHKRIYVTPSYTKKIFGNIRRVGKGFSRRETPLFPTMMVQAQEEMGEGLTNPTDPHHTHTIIQPSTSHLKRNKNLGSQRERTLSLERVATTASSLEAKQDSGTIFKTRSKATPNEPSSPRTSSSGGPKRQETIGDTIAQTMSENVSKHSNDLLLVRVAFKDVNLSVDEVTLAQALAALKSAKPKADKVMLQEPLQEPVKKLSKKDQLMLDEELAFKLQAEEEEEERLAREKAQQIEEANIVSWDHMRYGNELMFDTDVLDDDEVFVRQDMAEKEVNVAAKEISTADPVTTALSLLLLYQYYKVLDWKLYDSCGVDSLRKQNLLKLLKRLIEVTAVKLMLLVYKLPLLKITTAERVSTIREWIKTEERIKIDWRSRLLT
ncbi:hypothetical protein Tco_0660505 [Tanacetum coccineum]